MFSLPSLLFLLFDCFISVYYYFRPIVMMYFSAATDGDRQRAVLGSAAEAALAIAVVGVLYLGMLPDGVLNFFALSSK